MRVFLCSGMRVNYATAWTWTGRGRKEDMIQFNEVRRMPHYAEDESSGGGGTRPLTDSSAGLRAVSFDDFLKDKKNQEEFDRRMRNGIKAAVDEERARLESLADERVSEAERLSKMTEIEKQAYQQKKAAEKIAQREREITKRELMAEVKNTLTEKSIPLSLAGILDYSDAEKCNASLAMVEEAFAKAVEAGIGERLKGGKPLKDAPPEDSEEELEKNIYKIMKGR